MLTTYPGDPGVKGVRIGSLIVEASDSGNGQAVIPRFNASAPTKVVIDPIEPLASALRLEGWQCATGERLRLQYGTSSSTVVAALLPAATADNGRPVAYTGYMLFTAPGKWMITVGTKNGHLVGSAILLVQR